MIWYKFVVVLFFVVASTAFSQQKAINFVGNTNYGFHNNSSLYSQFEMNYKALVFEPKHKKWGCSFSGKISADYDHFGNETKINVFTVFGVDF